MYVVTCYTTEMFYDVRVIQVIAASGLEALGYLDLNGNLSQKFRDWHRNYQIYAITCGVSEKSQKIQCNVFYMWQDLQPKKFSVHGLFQMMKR